MSRHLYDSRSDGAFDGSDSERRDLTRGTPWRLVAGGPLQLGQFVVTHEQTGRTYQLAARTEDEARAQIELLNRRTLEIDA